MWGMRASRRLTPKIMIETPMSTWMVSTRNVGSGMREGFHGDET